MLKKKIAYPKPRPADSSLLTHPIVQSSPSHPQHPFEPCTEQIDTDMFTNHAHKFNMKTVLTVKLNGFKHTARAVLNRKKTGMD